MITDLEKERERLISELDLYASRFRQIDADIKYFKQKQASKKWLWIICVFITIFTIIYVSYLALGSYFSKSFIIPLLS